MKKRTLLFLSTGLVFQYAAGQSWQAASPNTLFGINSALTPSPITVGIGTNAPSTQLHTTGGVRFAGLLNNNNFNQVVVIDAAGNLAWRNAATLNNSWSLTGNAGTNPVLNFLGTTDAQPLLIKTNNVEQMRVEPANIINVGAVKVGTDTTGSLQVNGRDITGYSFPLMLYSNMRGLNWSTLQSTPAVLNTQGRLMRFAHTNRYNTPGSDLFYDLGIGRAGEFFITEGTVAPPPLSPTPLQRKIFIIDSNDNVGINLGIAPVATANFHTNGTVRHENLPAGNGNIMVMNATGEVFNSGASLATLTTPGLQSTCRTNNMIPRVTNPLTGDLGCGIIYDDNNSIGISTTGPFGYTYPGGGLWYVGTTAPPTAGSLKLDVNGVTRSLAYVATSDERYKKDIAAIREPMKIINALQGKTYYWNELARAETGADGNRQYGFIAQEVAAIFPEAAIKDQEGHYGLYYNAFIPVLTEAVKQQQQQIEELKQTIAQLRNGLDPAEKNTANADQPRLDQNAPNPFGSVTEIKFYLPQTVKSALIAIYDLNGRLLSRYPLEQRGEGSLSVGGDNLSAGLYLYSLLVDDREVATKRMVLNK